MLASEKNHRHAAQGASPKVLKNIDKHMAFLERQIEDLEDRMDRIVAASETFKAKDDILRSIVGIGPQVGFIFPVGDMQGYLNIKGYKEFAAENRPEGWNTWITFAISPAAAAPPPSSRRMITK